MNTRNCNETVAWSILLWSSIYKKKLNARMKVTVIYGIETGTSKGLAKHALEIFSSCFHCKLLPLNSEDIYRDILQSEISLFISSTVGNGEAPIMAESFSQESVTQLKKKWNKKQEWFTGLNYAVFGIGSYAYPNIAAFGTILAFVHQIIRMMLPLSKSCFWTTLLRTFRCCFRSVKITSGLMLKTFLST